MIELLNIDCMAYMAMLPDKAFDLAIVDPPYGINASEMAMGSGKNKQFSKGKNWDSVIPTPEYFEELRRVSTHQIIVVIKELHGTKELVNGAPKYKF